jgi:ribosomal protein S1
MSIEEAFRAAYGVNTGTYKSADFRPIEVGETIKLAINGVTRKGVLFDNGMYKEDIVSNVNLYQYAKFRDFTPNKPVECTVISKVGNKVVVDPLKPMFDKWLNDNVYDKTDRFDLTAPKTVQVRNLHRLNGGFIGNVRIDTVSDFVGQDVCVEAFIPGSHIVLNIESDFDKWEGETVEAFVSNYIRKPGRDAGMSLICSRKSLLSFYGQRMLIGAFNAYTENNDKWQQISKTPMDGVITGIINSRNKCGVFVEVPQHNITGMVEVTPDMLTQYHKGESISVRLKAFDEQLKYNHETGQMNHVDPYKWHVNKNGHKILDSFNLRPVFEQM